MLYRKVVLPALLEMPKPSQCAKQEPDSIFHSWFCPHRPPAAETFQRVRCHNLSPLLDFVSPAYIQALPFDVCKPEKLNVEEEVPISEYPNTCIFQAPDPIWVTSRSPQLLSLFGLSTPHFSVAYLLFYPVKTADSLVSPAAVSARSSLVFTSFGIFCHKR